MSKYPEQPGYTYTINETLWDKNMSYGFRVMKVDTKTNTYSKVDGFDQFDLPINPSNLSISIPFAINTLATTRGILEEHNGVVFRNIVVSGTTGVAAQKRKGGYEKNAGAGSFLGGVFAGALNTASNLANTVRSLGSLLTSAGASLPPLQSAVSTTDYKELGYAKLHQLLNYFVSYAQSKTQPGHESHRLIFFNNKDNVSYVVTPITFDVVKSAESPHIYTYKIALRAWAIENGNLDEKPRNQFDFGAASNNVLSRAMNTLRGARSVLSSASNTVRAVALDFNNIMSIGGEAMLVIKDAGKFTHTCADFPEMMSNQWNVIARGFEQKAQEIKDSFTGASSPESQPHGDRIAKAALKSVDEIAGTASTRATESPTDASGPAVDARNPFASTNDTISNIDLLDQYELGEISLSPAEQDAIDNKIAQARALTINDWDERRRQIEEIRDAYADSRQLGDASYDAAARRTSVAGTRRLPTLEDYVVLGAFNDMISVIDMLSATSDLVDMKLPDPFARAREVVGDSGITITTAQAAFSIPFPYNGSLEGLASMYLGDPDRWIEIAILNDLKPPFIDETGFTRSFTTSGNKNAFTISDKTNLFPNQEVYLSSSSQREEKRRIVKIDKLAVDNFLITVDGDDDLDRFTVVTQARLRAYLPNTVNSNMVLLIPCAPTGLSPADLSALPNTRELPVTMNLNKQQRLMGVDIALTDNFDLAVKNNGDVALSTGLANAIQAIKLKLATEKGQLKRHQDYGSGLPIGQRLNYTAQDIKLLVEKAIVADPRFTSVPNISVEFDGPTVKLNVVVSLANEGGVIPITFEL